VPLWGWLLLAVLVLLAAMWLHDRRVRARGARLNDPGTMSHGVTGPRADPEAHRGAMRPERWGGGI
jgi:hypothetical protein